MGYHEHLIEERKKRAREIELRDQQVAAHYDALKPYFDAGKEAYEDEHILFADPEGDVVEGGCYLRVWVFVADELLTKTEDSN